MTNPELAAASQLSPHDVSCSDMETAVTLSDDTNNAPGVRPPSTPPPSTPPPPRTDAAAAGPLSPSAMRSVATMMPTVVVMPGQDAADGEIFCGGGVTIGDGRIIDRLGSAATANVSGSSSSSSSSGGGGSGSESSSRRARVTGGRRHGAGSTSASSGRSSSGGQRGKEDEAINETETVNVPETTSGSAKSTAMNPPPAPAAAGRGGVWGSSGDRGPPAAGAGMPTGAGMGARPRTSVLRQSSGDLASLAAGEQTEDPPPRGGSEPSGTGVGRRMGMRMGARPKTSILRQSSGDLASLATAEDREGGGLSGLGGRGAHGEVKSPAALPGTSPASLPRTPDPNFCSPNGGRRGCAEVSSPRPRLSLSAMSGGSGVSPASGAGSGAESFAGGGGVEEGLGRPPVRGVPKPTSSAAAGTAGVARGSARAEDGGGSPLLPPLVPTSTASGGGGGGGVSGASAVPEKKDSASSTEDSAASPAAATTTTTTPKTRGGNDNNASLDRADEAKAAPAAARGEATCGLTLPVDGSGRAGRDYGPGIPTTRVSSWSAVGDESGGVVFAGNPVVGGGGAGSQSAAAEREDPPAGMGLRPALLLTGERQQRRVEDVSGAGSESSPGAGRAGSGRAVEGSGKASFVSEDDRAIEAAQVGDIAAVEAFLDRGGHVELRDAQIGMTLLGWAARRGHVELARLLLSNGASVKSRDGRDRTPLHRACSGCHVGIVEVLLEHGADPNARDATWRTPLHRAARWGSPGCSNLLLDAGADIEARDKELARTPLHFASRSGGLETTLVLLNNGADFNAKTVAGNTPLHLACDRGLVGNVKLLLEWGADPDSKNEAGAVPAEVAAPWVEDSVKASMQELLAARPTDGADADAAVRNRPQPAVIRPRPEGAAEKEAGLMESIRLRRDSMAECPECQQDILRQTHTFNSDGVPVAPSTNHHVHIHATRRSSSIRSSGKLKVCSTHRSRALPGEGGLPGLDDDLDIGLGLGLGGGGISGGTGKGEDEFRPRRGMGKTRKKQLSTKSMSKGKYEGGYRHGGCCSVQ